MRRNRDGLAIFSSITQQLHFYLADMIDRYREFNALQKAKKEKVPQF